MLLAAAIVAGAATAQESTAVKELIPTGKLRVGVVFAPAPTLQGFHDGSSKGRIQVRLCHAGGSDTDDQLTRRGPGTHRHRPELR
jgi:hypothetical protein